jgi:hypothetical protein
MFEDDDILLVPVDPDTAAWLWQLAKATGAPPADLVASMIRDIRVDDETAHRMN